MTPSKLSDDDEKLVNWYKEKGLSKKNYYLVVGRFVPENSFEIMIREFMKSKSKKDFALITNVNDKFLNELENKLHFRRDPRIKFVGTVYDQELLKKIRENAYAYFHGHTVGGTNPSLIEALGSTDLNLLVDIGFNREVAEDCALYWSKELGELAKLINQVEVLKKCQIDEIGTKAKARVLSKYTWDEICSKYMKVFFINCVISFELNVGVFFMNELISVVIPVYNVETYLDACVRSVMKQTYSNIEIILVDDGATDNSGEMCDFYAKEDSRVKVIHKDNGGLSDARNCGIEVTKGEFITFVDSDDIVSCKYIETLYSLIKTIMQILVFAIVFIALMILIYNLVCLHI